MPVRRIILLGGILGILASAGSTALPSQGSGPTPETGPAPKRDRQGVIPETTAMAVLATSLVGLTLAGLQKRRKG